LSRTMVLEFQKRNPSDSVAHILSSKSGTHNFRSSNWHSTDTQEEWTLVTKLVNKVLKSQFRSPKEVAAEILTDHTVSRRVWSELSTADLKNDDNWNFMVKLIRYLGKGDRVEGYVRVMQQDQYVEKIVRLAVEWMNQEEDGHAERAIVESCEAQSSEDDASDADSFTTALTSSFESLTSPTDTTPDPLAIEPPITSSNPTKEPLLERKTTNASGETLTQMSHANSKSSSKSTSLHSDSSPISPPSSLSQASSIKGNLEVSNYSDQPRHTSRINTPTLTPSSGDRRH
jgi:hypothetical protein